jgi:hypothetical protein
MGYHRPASRATASACCDAMCFGGGKLGAAGERWVINEWWIGYRLI